MKLKHYLKNFWLALIGMNPYKVELDNVKQQRDKAEARVKRLLEWAKTVTVCNDKHIQLVKDYQNLTENLRQHITDKDIRIDEMRRDYSNAIDTMRRQIRREREGWQTREQELEENLDAALERLKKVEADIGRKEMTSTNMLRKTDASLNDLRVAMASKDIGKMKSAVENLGWSDVMSQIAQLYLDVLAEVDELRVSVSSEKLCVKGLQSLL